VCAVLDAAGKPRLRAEDVLGAALSQFARDYQQFSRGGGFAPFLPRYYARWLHSGQTVEVVQVTYARFSVTVSAHRRTGTGLSCLAGVPASGAGGHPHAPPRRLSAIMMAVLICLPACLPGAPVQEGEQQHKQVLIQGVTEDGYLWGTAVAAAGAEERVELQPVRTRGRARGRAPPSRLDLDRSQGGRPPP
jgi:hypothetical protein